MSCFGSDYKYPEKMARFTAVFMFLLLLHACGFEGDSDDFSIGDDFLTSRTTVSVIDTFSVRMSTVKLDSLPTSGSGLIWAGSYHDSDLGRVTASSYFQIGLPLSAVVEKTDRYDSLVFSMHYSTDWMGDTTRLQELRVYELDEELKTDENGYLYNTSSFRIKDRPLGSVVYKPRPMRKGTLRVRLSDELGALLLEKLKNQEETMTLSKKFSEFFRGVALVPGPESSAVTGFTADTTARITLYMKRAGIESQQVTLDFPFASKETQFNRIEADRSGTLAEKIGTNREKLPSEMSGNRTFMQSGAGLVTRVEFPTMQRLVETDRPYIILKAELILVPLPGSYNQVALPEQIVLFHSDKANRVVSEIVGSDNTTLAAERQVDNVFHQDSWYRFDITDFLTTEIADAVFQTEHGLLIGESGSVMGKSLNRVVFSDQNKPGLKPLIKLYLLFYTL